MIGRRSMLLMLSLGAVLIAFWVGLQAGVSFNRGRLDGSLLTGARTGDYRAVEAALGSGANPNARDPDPRSDGPTPLIYALKMLDERGALALLKAGADVNARDNSGWTPLMVATGKGDENVGMVLRLLQAGADREAEKWDGKTALDIARERGFKKLAAVLAGQ
jgi:uncharacterized protein